MTKICRCSPMPYLAATGMMALTLGGVSACGIGPGPTQPSPMDESLPVPSHVEPMDLSAETPQAATVRPTDKGRACLLSASAVGERLGIDISRVLDAKFPTESEDLCSYQSSDGTVLDMYVGPAGGGQDLVLGGDPLHPDSRGQSVDIPGAVSGYAFETDFGVELQFVMDSHLVVVESYMFTHDADVARVLRIAGQAAAVIRDQSSPGSPTQQRPDGIH